MDIKLQLTCENIDWNHVASILKDVGMASFKEDVHQKAFKNSECVVFAFDADRLVGFGRAISDGAYEAAVYDVAVIPEYQGKGLGQLMMESIVRRLPDRNIILFASPGKESFYKKLGFKKMKTGMAIFANSDMMQEFTE